MGPPALRSHIKSDTHKKLAKESEDIDTDALKTFCDGKANQATKQRDQNLLQGNSLLKKDYKLSQQCTCKCC